MNVKHSKTTYESPLVFFEVVSTDEGFAQSGINSAAANYETFNNLGEI